MKARLVRIGNSRGIRLPKPVLAEAQLSDEVEIAVRDGTIVISSAARPRAGWSEAARKARGRNDDNLGDLLTATKFDDTEWKW